MELEALYQVFDLLPLTNGINQDGTKVTEENDGARYPTRYDHNTTEACVTHACPISYELPKFQNSMAILIPAKFHPSVYAQNIKCQLLLNLEQIRYKKHRNKIT